ncbi:hypothetical protein CGC21_17190 [Leishmania donovani]|uniref:Uncharacterized protein n=1 Tax=Leishmania donovani TaxID=5661 RepID=A0A504XR37_LEIDO|nr:hypothetical protein CGC21_17190 [Leishmania donovani]
MLQRRAGADDVTPHTGQAERGLGEEHRLPWPSTPAPPTLRSRARSAIKGCLPRPRSPSARLQAHLNTSLNKLQEADGGASPLGFVNPGAYRLGDAETRSSRAGLGLRASDSDTEAMPRRVVFNNVLATTAASTCRLRVYQESFNHPSGFAVPQRGAGKAVPCAVNAVPCSLIYGASNHASAPTLAAYRQAVAAETGIDPAQLRHGPLSARYDRVRGALRESISMAAEAAARVVSYRHGDGGPHASMDARANSSSVATKRQIRSGAFAWADKLSGLAQQRRARATARSAQLHSTRRVTGLPLRPDERRLYWAEHAPLHKTSVRGLNAVLQGVGEAEEGLLEETEVTLDHRCSSTDASCGDNDGDDDEEAEGAADASRVHMEGRNGLVDSHVHEDVTTDVENGARTRSSDHDGLLHHRTASDHRTGTPSMGHSRRTSPPRRSHSHEHPERDRHDDGDLLLYPPLLTPLLQEVGMRLRVHRLPTIAELWRWGGGDQEAILQIAGFRREERQTILWELERMIRVSSTRCALSAAA